MVVGIQIVGLFFGLSMMYFSFFYYRRKDFSKGDAALWIFVWLVFLMGVLFPQRLDLIIQTFGVVGALQLFTITSILFLTAVIFYLFRVVRKNQRQVEKLVRERALSSLK